MPIVAIPLHLLQSSKVGLVEAHVAVGLGGRRRVEPHNAVRPWRCDRGMARNLGLRHWERATQVPVPKRGPESSVARRPAEQPHALGRVHPR